MRWKPGFSDGSAEDGDGKKTLEKQTKLKREHDVAPDRTAVRGYLSISQLHPQSAAIKNTKNLRL